MKNPEKISSGNPVILSDREMKQVTAGYDPIGGCDTHGETCGGPCEGWIDGPERLIYVKGTCKISSEVMFLCGCVASGGGPT